MHVYFTGIDGSIPYPCIVYNASVFAFLHFIVDVSCMHQISFAHIVGGSNESPVVHILTFEHSVSSVPVVFECDVQLGQDVLGGEYLDIGFFLFAVCEQCSPVGQLRIRGFGVIHGECFRGIVVYPVRGIEYDILFLIAFEIVVSLDRRADYAQV